MVVLFETVGKFFVPIRLDDQRPWPEHGKSVETVDMVFFLFAFWLLFCSPNPANRCDFGCWTSHQVPHPVWVETLPKKEQRTKIKIIQSHDDDDDQLGLTEQLVDCIIMGPHSTCVNMSMVTTIF